MVTVEQTIKAMDEAGIRIKSEKCQIAKPEDTEWLGYKLSKGGIKPVEEKVEVMT